ncbi:trehalose-phosphatase [Nocardioides sp. Bht2]|uniref:trehalose-phosphatase n=1 Tax=Nocardioides sp. Bht2 TaxID=3392297 RepID=UPI0039B50065
MEFISPAGHQRYTALVRAAARSVVGLDMDGTLSPIVDDPAQARIHPDAPALLVELASAVGTVAVITGRPARQAVALGGFDAVGDVLAGRDRELQVFGQYGAERWSSTARRVIAPRPPSGLASFLAEIPALLRTAGAQEAFVEEKGLGVALHTRRMSDPAEALSRLAGPVTTLADRHHLVVEPGRNVLEVRAPGVDKGDAVRSLAATSAAEGFLFAGDDLGDLAAYDAVDELRAAGLATLLVCSTSAEQSALRERADLCVAGPDGVIEFLRRFVSDVVAQSV